MHPTQNPTRATGQAAPGGMMVLGIDSVLGTSGRCPSTQPVTPSTVHAAGFWGVHSEWPAWALVCWGTAVTGGQEGLLTDDFLPSAKLTDNVIVADALKTFSNNLDGLFPCKSNIQTSVWGSAAVFPSDHSYGRPPPQQNSHEPLGRAAVAEPTSGQPPGQIFSFRSLMAYFRETGLGAALGASPHFP